MGFKINKKSIRACTRNKLFNLASCKRSQVTIWIILAIAIIAAVILVFLLKGETIKNIISRSSENPQQTIEKCAEDSIANFEAIVLPQGGYISPVNYEMYKGNKAAYLCYNRNYYQTCVNQNPLYIEHLKQEIKSYISEKIEDCFYSLEQDYKDKNYQVNSGSLDLQVELYPGQVKIDINKKIGLTKNGETKEYEKFRVAVNSPLYDLAVIANEIVNQEAKFCYFENLGFELLYPKFSIDRTDINGEYKIYEIMEKLQGEKLIFAIRSCAMPAGL